MRKKRPFLQALRGNYFTTLRLGVKGGAHMFPPAGWPGSFFRTHRTHVHASLLFTLARERERAPSNQYRADTRSVSHQSHISNTPVSHRYRIDITLVPHPSHIRATSVSHRYRIDITPVYHQRHPSSEAPPLEGKSSNGTYINVCISLLMTYINTTGRRLFARNGGDGVVAVVCY